MRMFDYAVIDVVEALHGDVRGTTDPLPSEVRADLVAWLTWRVARWAPSQERYDVAVLALAMAALAEAAGS